MSDWRSDERIRVGHDQVVFDLDGAPILYGISLPNVTMAEQKAAQLKKALDANDAAVLRTAANELCEPEDGVAIHKLKLMADELDPKGGEG